MRGLRCSSLVTNKERKLSDPGLIDYHQPGFGDDSYDVAVRWVQSDSTLIGVWSVTSSSVPEKASDICTRALERGIEADYSDHIGFLGQLLGSIKHKHSRSCIAKAIR